MKLREWIDGLLEGFEEDSQQSHAEIYKEIDGYSKELKELERLAEIGAALELAENKAFSKQFSANNCEGLMFCHDAYYEGLFPVQTGENEYMEFPNVHELVEWYRKEVSNE